MQLEFPRAHMHNMHMLNAHALHTCTCTSAHAHAYTKLPAIFQQGTERVLSMQLIPSHFTAQHGNLEKI